MLCQRMVSNSRMVPNRIVVNSKESGCRRNQLLLNDIVNIFRAYIRTEPLLRFEHEQITFTWMHLTNQHLP
jgi:hypothetical protein